MGGSIRAVGDNKFESIDGKLYMLTSQPKRDSHLLGWELKKKEVSPVGVRDILASCTTVNGDVIVLTKPKKKNTIFRGVTVAHHLSNCRNVFLYFENSSWWLSTRGQQIAQFETENEALSWWNLFEEERGFIPSDPKRRKPVPNKAKWLG